jgi:hypothetical protein
LTSVERCWDCENFFRLTEIATRLDCSDAIKLDSASSYVTFDKMHIHTATGSLVRVAGGSIDRWRFQNSHLHDGARGFNWNAECHNSVVQSSRIYDIGAVGGSGSAVRMALGSYGNTFVDNVVYNCNFPAFYIYATNGQPRNRIIRNVIFGIGTGAGSGVQVTADIDVIGNVIAACGNHGVTVKREYDYEPERGPHNVLVSHNTIYGSLAFQTIDNGDGASVVVEYNNVVGQVLVRNRS